MIKAALNLVASTSTILALVATMVFLLAIIVPVFLVQQVSRLVLVACELVLMGHFHAGMLWSLTRTDFLRRMIHGDR